MNLYIISVSQLNIRAFARRPPSNCSYYIFHDLK